MLRTFRAAVLGAVLALGPAALSASCSGGPAPQGARPGAAGDAHAAATCPVVDGTVDRCDGSSPSFTFVPPLRCADDAGPGAVDGAPDAAPTCAGGPPFDGFVTSAACRALVAAEAAGLVQRGDAARAPVWASPRDGDALTADMWAVFLWSKGPQGRLTPLRALQELVEPSAHALAKTSGDVYVLEFTQGCTEILRVMTEVSAWSPDPAAWRILTSATGPITARVLWTKLAGDALGPSSTLVASAPITFTITH